MKSTGVRSPNDLRRYYSGYIMSAMASQITGVSIFHSTVCSGADQKKHQSSASLAFVGGNSLVTVKFPAQKASNEENVSLWWRHQGYMTRCEAISPSNGYRATRPIEYKRCIDLHDLLYISTLIPGDTKWRYKTWSASVHVMDCFLTAPSDYLNQY